MAPAIVALYVLLGVVGIAFIAVWAHDLSRRGWHWPSPYQLLVGVITDFLDTLGVGSFATTTTLYRFNRAVADEKIPGTLNVGHTLPTIAQALIYTKIIEVDPQTLVTLIAASVIGAWLGAGVVTQMSRRGVQIGMAIALLAAAGLMLSGLVGLSSSGGTTLGLDGAKFLVAIVGNFIFGALMTIGIGAYAPIMTMVSLLGMNPTTAFPIMMGSCAFLMPICSVRFIRSGAYDARAALGLAIGGIPAVLVAAYVVQSLPLDVVKWMVVAIVIYTALTLLQAAQRERRRTSDFDGISQPPPGK